MSDRRLATVGSNKMNSEDHRRRRRRHHTQSKRHLGNNMCISACKMLSNQMATNISLLVAVGTISFGFSSFCFVDVSLQWFRPAICIIKIYRLFTLAYGNFIHYGQRTYVFHPEQLLVSNCILDMRKWISGCAIAIGWGKLNGRETENTCCRFVNSHNTGMENFLIIEMIPYIFNEICVLMMHVAESRADCALLPSFTFALDLCWSHD